MLLWMKWRSVPRCRLGSVPWLRAHSTFRGTIANDVSSPCPCPCPSSSPYLSISLSSFDPSRDPSRGISRAWRTKWPRSHVSLFRLRIGVSSSCSAALRRVTVKGARRLAAAGRISLSPCLTPLEACCSSYPGADLFDTTQHLDQVWSPQEYVSLVVGWKG